LQQLLQLPYAHIWLPAIFFTAVVGCLLWFIRSRPALHGPTLEVQTTPPEGTVALTTANPQKAPKEQRQSARRKGNPIQVHIKDPNHIPGEELAKAYILDRSLGGVCVVHSREIGVGTVIMIRPANAEQVVPWTELQVRSCRPSSELAGEIDIGCQFVKTPPYSILLLFG
jgi:hypothetical protein